MNKGVNMIGNKILRFKTIDSTSTFIRNNVKQLKHGNIVQALTQTKGKGRHGSVWNSEEGNLYFSILLKEKYMRNELFKLVMKSSIAIVKTLHSYGIEASIKYPNDIIVGTKKIAGILIESIGYNDVDFVIIGIGINVNQINFSELSSLATSMKLILEKQFDINQILDEFIIAYNELLTSARIYDEYIKHSYVINKTINYNGEEYMIKSIERSGSIILLRDGKEQVVQSGDISLKDLYK